MHAALATTVLPQIPEGLQEQYHTLFPQSSETIDRVFAWLMTFNNGGLQMTEGAHINGIIRMAKAGEPFAVMATIIIGLHNQDDWLWERMTFHALAGIQGYIKDSSTLFAFLTDIEAVLNARRAVA